MSDVTEGRGSCLCGATRFTAKSVSKKVGACHCSMCRKWGGGPLMAVDCGKDVSFEGEESVSVDVRIISATHHSLSERVRQGKFRQDLYYRLNVIALNMPALREMRNDIASIAQQLLGRLRGDSEVAFSPEALQLLSRHDFPGNVRELENIIERALALCNKGIITPADLHLLPNANTGIAADKTVASKYPLTDFLDRVEREAILEALRQTGFNRTAAAEVLGITYRSLRYRLARLGIAENEDETGNEG